ncbi:DUF1269 domain-containing family protein [Lactobacillus corticis]|uniref:DUF1269 domain-containing family protein n=1 Tax=Lactobacillus corticis TaxID=2201249 RepID=A0A916QKX6_9LACO|nr:DUF1269 domain-containing family protein [Lactobacillus corticis]GFZ27336.1 hypothetical protein LCB40_12160 [Lactobacillus corticis]
MKKLGYFVLGTVFGAVAGFAAGSLLVDDDEIDEIKAKLKDNDKLQDLKRKYDNGTEVVKNQLASFPKAVEDDSEIKDFDDIVIDDSDKADESEAAADLAHAEDETADEPKPEANADQADATPAE